MVLQAWVLVCDEVVGDCGDWDLGQAERRVVLKLQSCVLLVFLQRMRHYI